MNSKQEYTLNERYKIQNHKSRLFTGRQTLVHNNVVKDEHPTMTDTHTHTIHIIISYDMFDCKCQGEAE